MLLGIFFLWQAFKTVKSERRFRVSGGADFQEEGSELYARLLKVFLHPPPPSGKRKLLEDCRYNRIKICRFVNTKY
jgi:hypothetical protein